MLFDVVLHDTVVAVGVDADVAVFGKRIFHDVPENMVGVREAGDAVDDMVGLLVVEPLSLVYLLVSRFR